LTFVEEVLKIAQEDNGRDLFVPELVRSSAPKLARQINRDLRNPLSHQAIPPVSEQRRLLEQWEPVLDELLQDLSFLTNYRLARISDFHWQDGELIGKMQVYQGIASVPREEPFPEGMVATRADRRHLVLLDTDKRILGLHPLYQIVQAPGLRSEDHLCFLKQRKQADRQLMGDSIQGAVEVKLEGFELFENMVSRILDRAPKA
jgi:hypothetical protein